MAATVLAPEMLDRLADHPALRGAPVLDALAPGLSDRRIDELTQKIGVELPEELRVLWRWRNGAPGPYTLSFGAFELVSLERAVELYLLERDLEQSGPDFGEGEWFPAHFFPFAQVHSDTTGADCAHPETPIAPVHHLPSHDVRDEYIAHPAVASLGEWAAWQLKALDERYFWWDREHERWGFRPPDDGGDRLYGLPFFS